MLMMLKNRKGQAMVEYGLLVSLISIAAIAALLAMGAPLLAAFQSAVDAL
jgi:Flp pilus assembly pilin Flp